MYRRIFITALLAGALAGTMMFIAHMVTTTPLILQAEVYENAASASEAAVSNAKETASEASDWAPSEGLERSFYTLVADILISIGFSFLLVGAIALSGRQVDWRQGLVWGLCGFAVFSAGPGMGLAPELPGMPAADLQARQIWWVATVLATAGGLALIFFGRQIVLKLVGAVLILAPHVVGAPSIAPETGGIPAEMAAEFAVATLVVSGLFWLALGGLAGHFYRRFETV